MYRWLVARGIRLGYRRVLAGDPRLLLRLASQDVRFVFPGHSSFAADTQGKAALSAWLERFVSLHPEFTIEDVMVTGMPWHTRAAVRFRDAIGTDYRNEGMEYVVLRWGRLRQVEVFLDTERITAWESGRPTESAA